MEGFLFSQLEEGFPVGVSGFQIFPVGKNGGNTNQSLVMPTPCPGPSSPLLPFATVRPSMAAPVVAGGSECCQTSTQGDASSTTPACISSGWARHVACFTLNSRNAAPPSPISLRPSWVNGTEPESRQVGELEWNLLQK